MNCFTAKTELVSPFSRCLVKLMLKKIEEAVQQEDGRHVSAVQGIPHQLD